MALYSCNLSSVGKTTHAAGTAGAHLRYIGRDGAEAHVLCDHMPSNPQQARSWMDGQERADRANARMIDKVRVALPLELNAVQRAALVRDYMAEMTGGRVPWFAAIHQTGEDAHNPHAHIVIRDRDIETGMRYVCLSDSARDWRKKGRPESKPIDYVRERWEHYSNRAYEMHGIDKRIDRRTLQAQGIDRAPTIHLGANGQHVDKFKARPESQDRPETTWRKEYRDTIPYPAIDQGRTRSERNAEIIDFNLEKAARSKDLGVALAAQAEKQLAAEDKALQYKHTAIRRRIRGQEDNVKAQHREKMQSMLQQRKDETESLKKQSGQELQAALKELERGHILASSHLESQHNKITVRLLRGLDITGRTRKRHEKERQDLAALQALELKKKEKDLTKAERAKIADMIAAYKPRIEQIRTDKDAHIEQLKNRHAKDRERIGREQQIQEIRREAVRKETEEKTRLYKQAAKAREQALKKQATSPQGGRMPSQNDNQKRKKTGGIQAEPLKQSFDDAIRKYAEAHEKRIDEAQPSPQQKRDRGYER